MPELPEVETVARSLRPRLVGRTVLRVETSGKSLRRPIDAPALRRAVVGARIDAIDRVGKYLLLRLSRGHALIAHLGMSGQLLFVPGARAGDRLAHTHVVFHLGSDDGGGDAVGGDQLRYVDPRRFGVLVPYADGDLARAPELSVLGPDPLSDAFTAAYFTAEARTSRRDVKQFLLDQRRVAGLGNIYVAEALHRAGISPRRRADTLGSARAQKLHAAIREILLRSVELRGTSLRDYVDADGKSGGNQHHLAVYGREGKPCPVCGTPIRRIVQGARSTFHCPRCQR